MAVFVIADLHLSLSAKNKSMEIFGGRWNDYINKLEKNWNDTVKESDSVIIAGDISWGMDINLCIEDFGFINNNLSGNKYILKGNHDYWWTTASKMNKMFAENKFDKIKILHNNAYICENYIICGTRGWFIDEEAKSEDEEHNQKVLNREISRLEMSIQAAQIMQDAIKSEYESEIIAFLHYPPIYGDYICPEIAEVLNRLEIKRCYFGHIHNANESKIKKAYKNVRFELVSADYLKFTPLKI